MKKTKKVIASLAISAMVATMMPFNAFAATGVTTDRLFGPDRFQTAITVSDKFASPSTAILAPASNANLVDALAAAPLAGKNAPILLTANDTLTEATKAQLIKLGVTKVYVVGAISDAVLAEVEALPGVTATALKGANRIETATKINAELTAPAGTFVVGYYALADALSVASFAAANNYSIVVANPDGSLPASANLASSNVYVIGGPTLVKDVAGAERLAGADRFATNKQVLDKLTFSYDKVFVANGTQGHLVDSLVASSLAAKAAAPIVLTNTATGGDAAAVSVAAKLADAAVITALGGATVVTDNTVGKVAGTVQVGDVELAISSVSALTDDGRVLSVAFNKAYVGAIDKSMVSIYATASLARVGVESVMLSSDAKTLEVTLYDTENNNEIVRLREYTVTVGGVKANFTRPAYVDKDSNGARVTAVDAEERELVVSFTALNSAGVPTAYSPTLEVPDTIKIDFQDALGQDIQVWYDGDNKVTRFAYESDKVLLDAIEVDPVDDELDLVGADESYDYLATTEFYINGGAALNRAAFEAAAAAPAIGNAFDYAKVILNDDGDVARVLAFNWDGNVIVEKVDGLDLIGYDEELDLEDYIIVKEGKQIGISDIKSGDIVYYNDAAFTDGYAEVFSKKVTGKINAAFTDGFELDGKAYDYDSAQSLDSDGDIQNFRFDEADDLDGTEVTINLDRNGDVVFVDAPEVVSTDSTLAGYLTDAVIGYQQAARDYIELEYVDEKGETVVDTVRLEDLEKITYNDVEYDVDATPVAGEVYAQLNEDEALANTRIVLSAAKLVAGSKLNAGGVNFLLGADNTLVNVTKDDDGNVTELEFFNPATQIQALSAAPGYVLQADDGYVSVADLTSKKLSDDVVVFDITADNTNPSDDDIVATTFGALSANDITVATVYYNSDREATHIIVANDTAEDSTTKQVLVTDARYNSTEIVRLTAFVDGVEKTYTVADVTLANIGAGSVVTITINDATGEVENVVPAGGFYNAAVTETVTAVSLSDAEITTGQGGNYELVSGYKVYDLRDTTDITVEALRDVANLDPTTAGIRVILDEAGLNKFVQAVVIVANETVAPTVTTAFGTNTGLAATTTIAGNGGTATITFSETLNAASKTAVENAISAADIGTGILGFSWNGRVLTITNTGAATPANDATFAADVTFAIGALADVAGNTNAGVLTVIDF